MVAVLAPAESSLLGFVSVLAPAIVTGNAIDVTGAPAELAMTAAENLKRVVGLATADDWTQSPDLARMLTYLETKTVWHPTGVAADEHRQ